MSDPDVSVLIPVLNESAHLRETIAAMRAQALDGRSLELVFADGRSDDDTVAVLKELAAADPRIRVFDNPARTTAAGLNVALAHARGRYVARMDAHAFFPDRYLAAGIERLERDADDDVVWVAGPVVPRANGGWSGSVAVALGTRLGVGGSSKWQLLSSDGEPTEEIALDTGVFAGVWRRETVEQLGGWDAAWPVNQDSELAARVHAAGGRIVCRAEMAAEYLPRHQLKALARQYWRHGRYRAKTNRRHPGSLRRTHLLPPALVVTAAAAVAAPWPLRRAAGAGFAVYGAALAATTIDAARHGNLREVAGLPVVLPVMHAAWGLGFLYGVARYGVTPGAVSALVRPAAKA
jgi:glycosyltransferase involved in cell wall biosynthesis